MAKFKEIKSSKITTVVLTGLNFSLIVISKFLNQLLYNTSDYYTEVIRNKNIMVFLMIVVLISNIILFRFDNIVRTCVTIFCSFWIVLFLIFFLYLGLY